MGLPNIVVEFIEKAKTAITRSGRGIVCIVLTDTTVEERIKEYKSILDVAEEEFTAENFKILEDTFLDGPSKVYVVRLKEEETFTDITAAIDGIKINWLAYTGDDQEAVTAYVKKRNMKPLSAAIKAVVYNQAADDRHVVNFTNETVTRKNEEEAIPGTQYLPRIAGMLAALPLNRSATYYIMSDLKDIAAVEDADKAIDAGEFVLINDYGSIKVGRAVNSATSVTKEDLKKITIIEGMDLMKEDILETFKNQYVGQYKNILDNQMVFIAAVNTYFRQMAADEVLNPDFENLAEIDVEKQRKAWADAGTTEALDWDDAKVKKMPFRTFVFVKGNVLFADAMEDLDFGIYLN